MPIAKKAVRKKTTAQKLKGATRARDAVPIHLFGHRRAEWKRVNEELTRSRNADAGMLQESPRTKELSRALAELEAQMREDTVDVVVEALRRTRTPATPDDAVVWDELVAAHPPRKGEDGKPLPGDANNGFNWATFPEALVRASIVEMSAEEIDQLLDLATEGQFDQLFETAWRLNKSKLDIPFSFAASKTLNSAPKSRRPSGSASAPGVFAAGNPAK